VAVRIYTECVLRDDTPVLIVGAGPAGLAVGACLQRRGLTPLLIEQGETVGWSWHHHYARLRLHTVKQYSGLPYFPFPAEFPRYPTRAQVIEYLERYARQFALQPRFGERVQRVYRADDGWCCATDRAEYVAEDVVVATGYSRTPVAPAWPGQQEFSGSIVHSSAYRSAEAYAGKSVLVVGMGNTGAEIALDLCEHGALPTLSVRGPAAVLPRDVFGVPMHLTAVLSRWLPLAVRDRVTTVIARLVLGDLRPFGLRAPASGPISAIHRLGRVPVLDVGTVRAIKAGRIRVAPGVERFTSSGAIFADGSSAQLDAVVLATGYRADLASLVEGAAAALDARGYPRRPTGDVPGLHFVGFVATSTGVLREVAIAADRVADAIATRRAGRRAGVAPS
jgi:indole-3-pyruvate monooxygenase